MRRYINSQSGMSLVSIVVVTALGVIIAAIGFRQIDNITQSQKLLQQRGDIISLRSHLTANMDCGKSNLAMGSCVIGTAVQIRKADNTVVVDKLADPTKIFGYPVRASCVQCSTCTNGRKYMVEVMLPAKPKGPKANTWIDLYEGIPPACIVP